MEYNKQEKLRHSLALGLAIILHGLLLIGAYYLSIRSTPASQALGYKIDLNTHFPREEAAVEARQETPVNTQAEHQPVAQYTEVSEENKLKPTPPTQTDKANKGMPVKEKPGNSKPTTTDEESLKSSIDKRGLYSTNQDKQAGALLEIVGWIWDAAPQPQDNTSESGKLVFEIKIDDLGEVIAVKTLEKTVSPSIEQIYQDALTELSFSKTTENTAYASTSTGKVTFIIQAK